MQLVGKPDDEFLSKISSDSVSMDPNLILIKKTVAFVYIFYSPRLESTCNITSY